MKPETSRLPLPNIMRVVRGGYESYEIRGSGSGGTAHTKGAAGFQALSSEDTTGPRWPTESERDEYEIYLAVKVLRAHAPHLLTDEAAKI